MGAPATLICKVVGLSGINTVQFSWIPGNGGTSIDEILNSDTQTSTLTIANPVVDKSYTCLVQSRDFPDSPVSETEHQLDVFSKYLMESELLAFVDLNVSVVINLFWVFCT